MQVSIDLPSLIIGLILGGGFIWLYYLATKEDEQMQKSPTLMEEILLLEKGLAVVYDLLSWFKRPNKKKFEKLGNQISGTYEKVFNYFLSNNLIEKTSDEGQESFCLTKEGQKICKLLDELSEEIGYSPKTSS
jgi:predicted transcriptional regulator